MLLHSTQPLHCIDSYCATVILWKRRGTIIKNCCCNYYMTTTKISKGERLDGPFPVSSAPLQVMVSNFPKSQVAWSNPMQTWSSVGWPILHVQKVALRTTRVAIFVIGPGVFSTHRSKYGTTRANKRQESDTAPCKTFRSNKSQPGGVQIK
jgi:hypothetical protein